MSSLSPQAGSGVRSLFREALEKRRGSGGGLLVAGGAALVVRVAGIGALLALQVVLARLLGAEGFGTWIYATTWIAVLAAFGAVGFDTSALRFVAEYTEPGRNERLHGFLKVARTSVLAASVVLAVALLAVTFWFRTRLPEPLVLAFRVASLLVPLTALLQVQAACLRGAGSVLWALVPQALVRPALLGGLVLAAGALRNERPDAAFVFGVDVAVTAILVVWTGTMLRRRLPAREATASGVDGARWRGASASMLLISGARLLANRTDVLMAGWLLGTTAAGFYAASSQLSATLALGLFAVNFVAAPAIARLHARESSEELQELATASSRATFAFSVLVGGPLLAFGTTLLGFYGESFRTAYVPLAILVASQLVNSMSGSVGFLMTMTGHEGTAARVTVATGVVNVVLNLLMIPRFGLAGAALATAISGVAWNLVLVVLVRRRLGIDPTILGRPPR